MALARGDRKPTMLIAALAAVVLVVGLPIGMQLLVQGSEAHNDDLRIALADVQDARTKVRERQGKKDALVARYAKRAPALASLIQEEAKKQKLEVSDSVDRPDVPVGKRYTERSTVVHFKKAGMYAISKFFEGIEKSGYPVALTRVNIRRRSGEPDSYDVEVGLSAYDRKADATPAPASSGGQDKEQKP